MNSVHDEQARSTLQVGRDLFIHGDTGSRVAASPRNIYRRQVRHPPNGKR